SLRHGSVIIRRMMGSLRALVIVVGVLAAARAGADPAADKARALELFKTSDAAYKAGEFEKAAELLEQAYALYPEPILLYNRARALDGMGATQKAIDAYEKYLASAPDVTDRGAIERRIATMREKLAADAEKDRRQKLAAERFAWEHEHAVFKATPP